MTSQLHPVAVGHRTPLITAPLFLEGITRSGKFLLANVINGFQAIEPVQYVSLLENLPYLAQQGLIDRTTAQEMMQCEVDVHSYQMMIGRNLNQRLGDKSAVSKVAGYSDYLHRSEVLDVPTLMSDFTQQLRVPMYILHETLPEIDFLFETFPQLQMITLRREPVDLVYSWYQRGHGVRWGTDPTMFAFAYQVQGQKVPWFAAEWADEYYQLTEIDRVIKSIYTLFMKSQLAYDQLKTTQRKHLHFVKFEDLLAQPQTVILALQDFLGKPISLDMSAILQREHLPNLTKPHETEVRLAEIKAMASAPAFKLLTEISEVYHS